MLNETAQGVFTIAVTPFLPNGALDFDSIDSMVDAYVERGATGLTILGMMGEAGKLSAEESIAVVERVVGREALPPPRERGSDTTASADGATQAVAGWCDGVSIAT